MKSFVTIVLIALIIINFAEFKFSSVKLKGSGNVVTEYRELNNYRSITVLGNIDVNIDFMDTNICRVTGDDNIIEHLKTEIVNDRLNIFIDKRYSSRKPLTVNLNAIRVDDLSITGSGDIKFNNCKNDKLFLTISGSGDIWGEGVIDTLLGTINGSGDLLLKKLRVELTEININGSGDAELWVSNSLIAI